MGKLSYKELQAQCKKSGLSASGKKQDLIARLQKASEFTRFACVVETFEHEVDYYTSLKNAGLL